MAARLRGPCLTLGAVTVAAGVLIGLGLPIGGVLLPGGSGPMFAMTAATGVFLGLFLLVSGATMTLARQWVTTIPQGDVLDRRKSGMALYPLGVPVGAGLFTSLFFYVTFLGRFTWSAENVTRTLHLVTPGVAAYLTLPAVAVALCVVNVLVAWPLFRPSQRTIERYAR
ncbi:hypothetical protein [Amycolatopsis sp. cg9]|uniref:hypothetical protein n=1 Tax=Amycolatopsis sp. cg9 TaxID=3238801 RepID=UPI0035258200